jgi:ATP-binding cassette, subfamily B, bacterial
MKNRVKKKDLKEFFNIIKDRRIFFLQIISLFLLLLTTSGSLLFPSISARIIDEFFLSGTLNINLFIVLLVVSLFIILFSYFQTYSTYLIGEKFSYVARNKLYKKVIEQPEKYFIKHKKSKLLTVIMSDINIIKEIFSHFMNLAVTGLFLVIGSVILMFSLNSKLATIIVIFVPVSLAVVLFIVRNIKELFKKIQKERDNFNRIIDENVKASMLVRVFTSENEEIEKFQKTNYKSFDLEKKVINKFAIILPSVNLVNFISTMFIIYFGGIGVINDTMTLGEISAFNSYITMFIMPILMIAMISNFIGQAFASIERISYVLNSKESFENGNQKLSKINLIETKNLGFEIEKKKILKKINFNIKKGELVGIIGLTGSGKSMLMQLLLRLIEPSHGKILINKKDIKDYDVNNIRNNIGIVFQDNFLIDDTIDNNIDFKRNLPAENIKLARKIAEVEEFYKNKKPSYKIGELGKNLSGGQKQRLRIARAVACNPDVLILDDCTSNLDAKTEEKIINNIKKEFKDIAIIIISQKISSLKNCNRIYVMDNGEITSSGNHEYLRENSLLYKEIELTQKNMGN